MSAKPKAPLSERAANAIAAMIADEHRFSPGDKLPNELDLSEELGVSRITLREAVRILCTRGMLEIRRGKGTYVISDDPDALPAPAAASVDLTAASRRDLLELRLAIEPAAAYYTARRASEKEIQELRAMVDRIAALREAGQPFAREEASFHAALVRASGNGPMAQTAVRCPGCSEVSYALSSGEGGEGVVQELRELARCLRERDGDGARAVMRLHLLRAFQSEGIE